MGRTIEPLAQVKIGQKAIFNNRFVIELCEKAHIHYRNIRIVQSLDDFINTAEAFVAALDRWKKRGCPGTGATQHIELCRKKIAVADESDTFQVNLNENLYKKNEGGIFAEGADFNVDNEYIHVKIRDCRWEFSVEEFKLIAKGFKEANDKLCQGDSEKTGVN